MEELRVLADAPAAQIERQASEQGTDSVVTEIPIARVGRFKDQRYGRFAITTKDFEDWARNFDKVHPNVKIDVDHSSERGGSTEAAGWITKLRPEGEKLMARVEWTPLGVAAVRERRFRFISPGYGPYIEEDGTKHKNVLRSAGLTNDPFLRHDMPAITLSQAPPAGEYAEQTGDGFDVAWDELDRHLLANTTNWKAISPSSKQKLSGLLKHYAKEPQPFTACVRDNTKRFGPERAKRVCAVLKDTIRKTTKWREGTKTMSADELAELDYALTLLGDRQITMLSQSLDPSDSPRHMPEITTEILKALGLPEDTEDEQMVLDRATELAARPEQAEDTKTLDQRAADEDKVLLDRDSYEQVKAQAAEGAEAAKTLHTRRFEDAFDTAQREGRVDAKEDTKQLWQENYEANDEGTLKLLSALPKVVSTVPSGSGGGPGADAPAGVDPERHQVDQQVKALMAEKPELDYPAALDQVMGVTV